MSVEIIKSRSGRPAPFEEQAREVLRHLRRVLGDVLASVESLRSTYTATDVQRALGINSKLSWQVQKFATTEDPLQVAAHLPKPAAMRRFCDAAKKAGATPDNIERLLKALKRFEQIVELHAGDRATFDAMVGSLHGEAAAAHQAQQHQRDAFRAQSHIWGMQAKATISLMIFKAGRVPGTTDGITVAGHVHLRRFRRDARWIVFGRTVASDKRIVGSHEVQPLIPEDHDRYGASMIAKYSTFSGGAFRTIHTPSNLHYIEAVSDEIGNDSAATYFSGDVWRNIAYTQEQDGARTLLARLRVRIPVEVVYHDIFIHRDLNLSAPDLRLFGDLRTGDDVIAHDDADRLPCYETVSELGTGADAAFAQEFPSYAHLVHDAMTTVGWNPDEFKAFRCRLPYPVLPSTAVVRFTAIDEPRA